MHGKGKGKEQGKAMTTETPSPNAAEGQQPGKHGRGRNATNATEGNATGAESPSAGGEQGKHGRKGRSVTDEAATANKANSPAPSNSVAPSATAAAQTNTNVNAGANVNANANVAGGGRIRGHGKGGKQLDAQVVQKVKTEHASFKAQPRPDKVQAVTFSENHRIEGAEHWQGERYAAFRSYHSEHHDHDWWHSHYPRIEIIAGGAYYWNNGYWYPAWGYDNSAQYYAYDGPIYVGHRAEPPDKVIADVQAVLQDAGYYTGEVDGLLGPLTRQALADYQSDNGLMVTQAIDEPTLESLDLS
jgi:hypothetical protein